MPEHAMYVNRKQDGHRRHVGICTTSTAGLQVSSAFQNSPDMAVQLGFKSFTGGGHTFHKHDWKLLNDPTLLGAVENGAIQGAMVPLRTVNDARSGALFLRSTHYKEANGYFVKWSTG